MANQASNAYPNLIPTPPVGGGVGLPASKTVLPWQNQTSDQTIRGAAKINPALAPAFVDLSYAAKAALPNYANAPLEVTNKVVAQTQATSQGKNAWKKRTLAAMSNAVMFGNAKPQKPFKVPWNKVFIPPLALFNDASQWVNRLMFNQPMQASGSGNSMPNLMVPFASQVVGSGSNGLPIITNNLAAGTLNAQLQLGQMTIQAAQLTINASNFFGGS